MGSLHTYLPPSYHQFGYEKENVMRVTSKLLMLIDSNFRMGKKIKEVVCERREGGEVSENERGWGKELGRENGKSGEERKRSSKNKN